MDIKGVRADIAASLVETIKGEKKLLSQIKKYLKRSRQEQQQQHQCQHQHLHQHQQLQIINNTNGNEPSPNNNRFEINGTHTLSMGLSDSVNDAQEDILKRIERQERNYKKEQFTNAIPKEMKEQGNATSDLMDDLVHRINVEESKNQRRKSTKNEMQQDFSKSVTISCLIFILDLVVDQESKSILRFAALATATNIIQKSTKSNECSIFLLSYPIKKVIDSIGCVVNQNNTVRSRCDEQWNENDWMNNQMLLELWKIFNQLKLQTSKHQNYCNQGPRINVTIRYLEEQRGVVLSKTFHDNGDNNDHLFSLLLPPSMSSFTKYNNNRSHISIMKKNRHIRDIALKYGEKEISRVHKLLLYVDDCLNILVQRFGVDNRSIEKAETNLKTMQCITNPKEENKTTRMENTSDDIVDDEMDDVDWEDGDDEYELFSKKEDQEQKERDHRAAVESSIAIMKETGALDQEGYLEVDLNFSTNGTAHCDKDTNILGKGDVVAVEAAREKMNKCIMLLSNRYKPRLDAWIHALMNADNMTKTSQLDLNHYTNNDTSSMVLLSISNRKKRVLLLRDLCGLKSNISRAIDLAKKSQRVEDSFSSEKSNSHGNDNHNKEKQLQSIHQSNFEGTNSTPIGVIPWQRALGLKSVQTQMKRTAKKRRGIKIGKLNIKLRKL